MPKKLKLSLEDLTVKSFTTGSINGGNTTLPPISEDCMLTHYCDQSRFCSPPPPDDTSGCYSDRWPFCSIRDDNA